MCLRPLSPKTGRLQVEGYRLHHTMSQDIRSQSSPLPNLPSEIIESILIFATTSECYTAVAAVAQTCRTMRLLVYEASDRRLWRELFLAVFDDPRTLAKRDFLSNGEAIDYNTETVNWAAEFKARVWARHYLRQQVKRETKGNHILKAQDLDNRTRLNMEAFETIIRVITTLYPCAAAVISSLDPEGTYDATRRLLTHSFTFPVFPPLSKTYGPVARAQG
jgi:hypothetical protein